VTPPAAAAAPGAGRARTTAPRPSIAPRRPRRVSGPARPAPGALPRVARPERGLVPGLAEALAGVSRRLTLDRLIRGRAWIALIAFALIGIVTLQLLVLTLKARIGHALVHETQLQRENATLSIESSELAAGERVESLAERLGMELVQVSAVRFLSIDPRADIARAAAALNASSRASDTSSGEASAASPAEASAASPAEASAAPAAEASGASATEAGASESAPTTTETATGASAEQAAGASATATAPTQGEAPASPSGEAAPEASSAAGGTQPNGAG